jgi:hypothetical protein
MPLVDVGIEVSVLLVIQSKVRETLVAGTGTRLEVEPRPVLRHTLLFNAIGGKDLGFSWRRGIDRA